MQSARLLVAVGVVSLFGIRAHRSPRRRRRRRYQHRQHSAGHLHRRIGECDRDLEHRQRDGRGDPRRRRHLQTPSVPVIAGATQQEMLFRVTNTGNGPETFRLQMTSVLGGDEFDPVAASPSIYFDTDASGDLSPGDTPYVVGSNDPVLECRRLRDRAGGQRHSRRRRRRQPRLLAPARPTRAPASARRARPTPARAPAAPTRWSAPPAPTAKPRASTWSPASR